MIVLIIINITVHTAMEEIPKILIKIYIIYTCIKAHKITQILITQIDNTTN